MLPNVPPKYGNWGDLVAAIRPGETGWRVFALQRALLKLDYKLPDWGADGAYGKTGETFTAVKKFQKDNNLVVDGIVGPATQGKFFTEIETLVHKELPKLPQGVLEGFTITEGAGVFAATNWYTPPGGKAGVDCGPVQWRQYGPPFSQAGLKRAFDVYKSYTYAGETLLERMAEYKRRRPSLSNAMTLRLALLAHNWPAGAEQYVVHGRLLSPEALATWTTKPSGGHYTRAEWLQEYPDRILLYVK